MSRIQGQQRAPHAVEKLTVIARFGLLERCCLQVLIAAYLLALSMHLNFECLLPYFLGNTDPGQKHDTHIAW